MPTTPIPPMTPDRDLTDLLNELMTVMAAYKRVESCKPLIKELSDHFKKKYNVSNK